MFNLGSNGKNDLEENMEEIKNLIQEGDGQDQETPEPRNDNLGGGLSTGSQPQQNSQGENRSFEDKVRENHEQEQMRKNPGGESMDFSTSNSNQENSGNLGQERPSQDQIMNKQQNSSQQSERSISSEELKTDISNNSSESGSEQESSRPQAGGDTLFLREEEFRNIRERVEEMNYLTQEMESSMKNMKKTVRRERETSKNAVELVEAFSQRRSDIESTINSGQK